jgi:hypothetical protein
MEGFKQCKRCTMTFVVVSSSNASRVAKMLCPECGLPFWHRRTADKQTIRCGVLPENAHKIPQTRKSRTA